MLRLLAVFLVVTNSCESARILGVFHMPSYSHNAAPNALIEELARRGHDITVLTSSPRNPPVKNIRDIDLPGFKDVLKEDTMNLFDLENANAAAAEFFLNRMILKATDELLKHKNVQQLLNSEEKFDLVIIEDFVGHALKGFPYHFKAPCIMINSMGLSKLVAGQVGNPYFPSYITDVTLPYSSHMSFFQRLHNSAIYLFTQLFQQLYVIPQHNQLLQKYFPNAPHIDDVYYNVSLLFLNAHVSVQQPVPYVPNAIDIGGIHVKPPKKLSKDLQEYLDSAKDGVIFFSMGSNLKSAQLPVEKREAILKTFQKLKQKVLWKFEDENLPGKPANVKIGKWLPQSDVLAHPNVKLFITHGGLLSQIEAVHRGVPVFGIPVYGDQRMNLVNAESKGTGLWLPYGELNEETFSDKIQEILTNPKYEANAKRYAQIMHDQPTTPLERATFWVEYVLRHKGAPHLRTAALNLTWYQYLLLDVILFVAVAVTSTMILFCIVLRKLFTCRKKSNKTKNKKD